MFEILKTIILLLIVMWTHFCSSSNVISYNLPKLCSNASWNSNGTTFVDKSIVGEKPIGMFVDNNNTVYIADKSANKIYVWTRSNGCMILTRNISGSFRKPNALFVSLNGDIYIENGEMRQVQKWTLNSTDVETVMSVEDPCFGLFLDINNTLYWSMKDKNKVMKLSLDDPFSQPEIAAGTGSSGNTPQELNAPHGIFVDINFNLYVADFYNDRVQQFKPGQNNGITVAGGNSPVWVLLNRPTGVVLDFDSNLYIVDSKNHRIIVVRSEVCQCLVGCSRQSGSAPDQLNDPYSIVFDSYGNLFVTDQDNSRIQMFTLETNSCDQTTTRETILTTQCPPSTTTLVDSSTTVISTTTNNNNNKYSSQQTTSTELSTSVDYSSLESTHQSTIKMTISSSESSSLTTIIGINEPYLPYIIPLKCDPLSSIGYSCNISFASCHVLQPCRNLGNCTDAPSLRRGYYCTCASGFGGYDCEFNIRPCKPNFCLYNSYCVEVDNTFLYCNCTRGRTGTHCEFLIDYCQNVTCFNKGMCRRLLLDYKCECLSASYWGRHCEHVVMSIVIRRYVSKAFGYTAIIALSTVACFVIIMDILKYCFGIDLVRQEYDQIRRGRSLLERRPRKILRVQRVNKVSPSISTIKQSTIVNK